MKPGRRLETCATEVARLRREIAADAHTRATVGAVKQWQAQRLARTHRRLLGDPRYAAAARFFLDDLYGAKDFSRRDAELARLVPTMVRLLPDAALETIADAIEMDALSPASCPKRTSLVSMPRATPTPIAGRARAPSASISSR